jgi:flagellar basal-body rod protein FlgB
MTTQDLSLFQAIGAKMNYLVQRQAVLSQNIANADTAGYRPNDLKKVDFSTMLNGLDGGSSTLEPVTTNAMDISPAMEALKGKSAAQKTSYEIAPSGNGVSLEEQMVKQAQNGMDYGLMTTIYQKNVNMLRTAIDSNAS